MDDLGIQNKIIYLLTGGKHSTVPVHDVSASEGNGTGVIGRLSLGQNYLVVLLAVIFHQHVYRHDKGN